MDFETIILGILATTVFLLPILYLQRKQKGSADKLQQSFLDAAQQQGLQLSTFDFWGNQYGIGLDKAQGKLYYRSASETDPQEASVYLNQVRRSTVDNVHREQNGNRIIDMVALRISLHGPKAPELYLPFYNREANLMLNGELQLAEKWCILLQEEAAKQPSPEATAVPRTSGQAAKPVSA